LIGVGAVLDGRYELRRLLGAGGMGAVYLAFDRRLEREVAIKALLPQLAGEEELLARFLREARALAGVRHPNIVTLHDLLALDEGLYLVMDLVPGRPLDEEIRREGPLSWHRCADLGTQVCGGLAAIHARDVIHRDIKPSNILVEPTGVYRVADFGLVRMGGATRVTRTGAGMGTPGYWAPEQERGDAADARADLYSLGAVLYAAATGFPPLAGDPDAPAPDPRRVAPGLPDAAAEVVMRAMAPDPADRYASAVEMALALRASAGLPLSPVTPLPPTQRLPPAETLPPSDPPRFDIAPASEPEPPPRRRAAPLAAGVALVVVAAVAGLGLGSLRDGGAGAERVPAGAGSVAVPDDWTAARGGARLAGTALANGLTARPPGDGGERLVAGTARVAGPALLPPRLAAEAGRPARVRLGAHAAYRYRDLTLDGGALTVFALPTASGVVQTIACSAPPERMDAFAPRCEAVAASLALDPGAAAELGPRPGYAAAVTTAVTRLNRAVPDLRRELARATSRAGQAAGASALASAYSAAGDALKGREPGLEADGLNAVLAGRLEDAASAYTALAAAATAGDAAGYEAARAAVAGAEDAVRDALGALARAGYDVAGP
jgi:hypothetical protein